MNCELQIKASLEWLTKKNSLKSGEACSTRDLFQGKLDNLYSDLSQLTLDRSSLMLFISVLGEIGNNSFDHNLGQWKNSTGCWLSNVVEGKTLKVVIADSGQGVLSSLKRVSQNLKNDQEALEVAFEKMLSGRAPEKRGNGLKYVRSVINGHSQRALICTSYSGVITFGGASVQEPISVIKKSLPINGTLTYITWEML